VFLAVGKAQFEVLRLASGLIRQVQTMAIPHPGRRDGLAVVTVSLGVALRQRGQTKSVMQVMNEADEALYQAKRGGRNRFSCRPT
jgi:diguanylate cyclase (GGDEF)-like protein